MKLLTETLQKLVSTNLRIFYNFEFGEDFVVLETKKHTDDLNFRDLSRFALKSPNTFEFTTKIKKITRNTGTISIVYSIGDPVTTYWLANGENDLFYGLNTFATCELTGGFQPSEYLYIDDESRYISGDESGIIDGDNLTCKINIRAGFEFDPNKVRCLAKYIDYYNSYDDSVKKKCLILDQFYSDMSDDFKNSTNSLDDISTKYYVAKLANDPDILANY